MRASRQLRRYVNHDRKPVVYSERSWVSRPFLDIRKEGMNTKFSPEIVTEHDRPVADESADEKLSDFTWSNEQEEVIKKLYDEYKRVLGRKDADPHKLADEYRKEMKSYCEELREIEAAGKKTRMMYILQNNLEEESVMSMLEDRPTVLQQRSTAIIKAKCNDSYMQMSALFPNRARFRDAPKTPEKFRKIGRRAFDTNLSKFKLSIYSFLEKHVVKEVSDSAKEKVIAYWGKLESEDAAKCAQYDEIINGMNHCMKIGAKKHNKDSHQTSKRAPDVALSKSYECSQIPDGEHSECSSIEYEREAGVFIDSTYRKGSQNGKPERTRFRWSELSEQ